MTEVSIIVLALALVILCFRHNKLAFEVKELEGTVWSHWSAIQKECGVIWGIIDPKEYDEYGNEIEKEVEEYVIGDDETTDM